MTFYKSEQNTELSIWWNNKFKASFAPDGRNTKLEALQRDYDEFKMPDVMVMIGSAERNSNMYVKTMLIPVWLKRINLGLKTFDHDS
jgi:hypothetical protein